MRQVSLFPGDLEAFGNLRRGWKQAAYPAVYAERAGIKEIIAANNLTQCWSAQAAKQHAGFSRNRAEIILHHLGASGKAHAQSLILRGNSHWTRIEVTLARHHAAHGKKRGCAKAELVRAEQCGNHDIAGKLEPAIHAKAHV